MNPEKTVWRRSGGSIQIPPRVAKRAGESWVEIEGCWVSTYSRASHGYAQIGWNEGGERLGTTAHRASWTWWRGAIPPGMTVDHLCRNRPCVNPEHLRLLTNLENATDNNPRIVNLPTGRYCLRGHEKVGRPGIKAYCRVCRGDYRRAKREEARASI